MSKRPKEASPEDPQKKLDKMVARAQTGEEPALSKMVEALDAVGGAWAEGWCLSRQVEDSLIKVAAGENHLTRIAYRRQLDQLREELAGPDPSPMERLLVDRIVACWQQTQYADSVYIQNAHKFTLEQGDYYQRRQDRTHRRFLSAVKMLATIRKLGLPTLQVNIADQQVNVVQ